MSAELKSVPFGGLSPPDVARVVAPDVSLSVSVTGCKYVPTIVLPPASFAFTMNDCGDTNAVPTVAGGSPEMTNEAGAPLRINGVEAMFA